MIAVFFGGRSCEHDISIITGLQAMSACRKQCVGVYIDSDGVWWEAQPAAFSSANAVKQKRFDGKKVHIRPGERRLYVKNRKYCEIDAALLCMHGMLGEDGTLQGLLEVCGVPYTGSDVAASAIGMNKLRAKTVFESAGLDVLPYTRVLRSQYTADAAEVTRRVTLLGYPVIVKPCNLGSSIGITVVHDNAALFTALRVAFEWDDTVIVEKALEDFTEVNCAVLGDSDEGRICVSDTEQPVGWKEFLTFADKYSGDVKHSKHKIPADIGAEQNEKVQELAEAAFRAVGCSGVARVDFLVKGETVYVNEINTIPGSLASGLFASSMNFSQLIDRLIEIAVRRARRKETLKRVYTPIIPVTGK